MIIAMILSIIFTIIDICAVTDTLSPALPIGINPFWKLAFVFKLLTDSVVLDDFKTALDKLSHYNLSRIEDQLGGNWVSSTSVVIARERTRESPVLPNATTVAGGRREVFEPVGSRISVTTET